MAEKDLAWQQRQDPALVIVILDVRSIKQELHAKMGTHWALSTHCPSLGQCGWVWA